MSELPREILADQQIHLAWQTCLDAATKGMDAAREVYPRMNRDLSGNDFELWRGLTAAFETAFTLAEDLSDGCALEDGEAA